MDAKRPSKTWAGYGANMSGFVTPRLRATPVSSEDAAFFRRLWSDEQVARTLGMRDAAAADNAVIEAIAHWQTHGFGRWMLWLDDVAVGTVKIAYCEFIGTPEVELGYAILPEFWGRGYATEGARGALDYARDHTDLTKLIALTLPDNARSIAVLRRLGFLYAEDVELPDGAFALYRLLLDPA
jgi:RimJ/RimL family protein N-acetyltransferase